MPTRRNRIFKQVKLKNSKYKPELPDSIKNNANLIDEKLQNIRVCDPAIGSGAFPVGMMNEIVKARMSLNPYVSVIPSDVVADLSAKTTSVIANEVKQSRSFCHSEQSEESRTPYNFKRHAIQNCLYGVDIDSEQ